MFLRYWGCWDIISPLTISHILIECKNCTFDWWLSVFGLSHLLRSGTTKPRVVDYRLDEVGIVVKSERGDSPCKNKLKISSKIFPFAASLSIKSSLKISRVCMWLSTNRVTCLTIIHYFYSRWCS